MLDLGKGAVDGRVPFVPGTGTNNIDETIDLTQYAERIGVDAALVIVPYYNRPSQEGLFRYFRAVAQQVDLPIIIYNIPGRTATNMAPETMARLREACPNIIGVKESNKDFEHTSQGALIPAGAISSSIAASNCFATRCWRSAVSGM